MDGPREPGFCPSVTGSPERHTTNGVEGRYFPPRFLFAQVHRYGPRRWWVVGPLALLIPAQSIDLVWESERIPVNDDVMSADWQGVSDELMREAKAMAECRVAMELRYEAKISPRG